MVPSHSLVALLFVNAMQFYPASSSPSTVYMIMEYSTDGTVILNNANFTIHTVSMNVTLLGCDYGYYDNYLLVPSRSPRAQITPFDCRQCVCTEFNSVRAEEFTLKL